MFRITILTGVDAPVNYHCRTYPDTGTQKDKAKKKILQVLSVMKHEKGANNAVS